MIEQQEIQETRYKLLSIICNKCGKKRYFTGEEGLEAQEYISIRGRGGFNSIIGDETEFNLDLCQHCFVGLCNDYLEYPEDQYD